MQASISQALRSLPQDIQPPSFRKVDPSSQPILYYALRTKTLPLFQLNEYAETFLAQRLSTIDGVAQVQVFGSRSTPSGSSSTRSSSPRGGSGSTRSRPRWTTET